MDAPVHLTQEAVEYAARQLAWRAGLRDWSRPGQRLGELGIPLYYAQHGSVDAAGPAVYITPAPASAWRDLLTCPPESVDWLAPDSVFPPESLGTIQEKIPVLLWGEGCGGGAQPFAEILPDGSLVFYVDILSAALFLLTRWEESAVAERDAFGRFIGQRGAAFRLGFFDRPLVDEYGLALRAWLSRAFPGWQPAPRRFSVQLTHDIDHFFVNFRKKLEYLYTDLVKRLDWAGAAESARLLLQPGGPDPMQAGIQTILEASRRFGLSSTFYWMAAAPSKYDEGYDITSAKKVLASAEAQGCPVGLHTSFVSFGNLERVKAEKARLEQALGRPVQQVRQHYLLARLPESWRLFEQAGFREDASMGFSELAGFRCGTCYPYPVFDLQADREMALVEKPLIVMDWAARSIRKPEAVLRVLTLARRCQRVGGDFTLLWHNSSFTREFGGWQPVYLELLAGLKRLQDQTQPLV